MSRQSHSGFAVLKHTGKEIITTNIHKYVLNVNKAINDNIYTWGSVFFGSSTSWANMVVKASKRAYMSRQSHSDFAVLKHTGRGIITIYMHHNVVNINKAINDII